jgi:hypothetical protein
VLRERTREPADVSGGDMSSHGFCRGLFDVVLKNDAKRHIRAGIQAEADENIK